jgi:hypothetical protein
MWVEIRKPGDQLPSTVDEFRQKEIDLEEKYMIYNGFNQFDLDYDGFNDPGKYTIYFYVKDSENIISGFDETYVYKNKFGQSNIPIVMKMNQQGKYIKRVKPGAYEAIITADHYNSNKEIIIINDIETLLSFALQSIIQTGDINRNENHDLGDAIQCLQILSRFDNTSYFFDQSALTGDRLELRDAIFILQRLASK